MTENKTTPLTEQEQKEIIKKLKMQEQLFSLQAAISKHKADIAKNNYEYYTYSIRLHELKNPKEKNEPSSTDSEKGEVSETE